MPAINFSLHHEIGKSQIKPKEKHQKEQEAKSKITEVIEKLLPFYLMNACSASSTMRPFFLPCSAVSFLRDTLPFPAMALLYILIPAHIDITSMTLLKTYAISLPPMLPRVRTVGWISITLATLCSNRPAITASPTQTSLCSCEAV